MRIEMKKTCICSTDVFCENQESHTSVFLEKKDNLLHWWAHFLSQLHCLSNTMQGEFAECKQRWDVSGLRAAEIEYDRAWMWWMTQLCHVQGLRMVVRLPGLGWLFLATLGLSWTFLRTTHCKFKLFFRRTLGMSLCELPAQRWCVNSCSDWHMGKKEWDRGQSTWGPMWSRVGLLRNSSWVGRANGNWVVADKPPCVWCIEMRLEE